MTVFVGSEYLMGFGLIKKLQSNTGEDSITLSELRDMAWEAQVYCNEHNVDVVIMTNFDQGLYEYDDYFQTVKLNGNYYVQCVPKCSLDALKKRFIGYLPLDIVKALCHVWLGYNM